MKKYLPDLLTLLNLMCGVCAAIMALWGLFIEAYCFIMAGAVFDIFDGALARRLGVSSPMGRELDSLSDLVSFGLAPSLMLFCWYYKINCGGEPRFFAFVPLLMVAFTSVRLARFNIYQSGEKEFHGLASPASGILAASAVGYGHCCTIAGAEGTVAALLGSAWFIPSLSAALCILLVCNVSMFSAKSKPGLKHILLGVGAAAILIFEIAAAPRGLHPAAYAALFTLLLFGCYILISLLPLHSRN